MPKKILLILLGLSLSLLTSCAHVPDVPVCVEITLDKGWCTNTISDKEYFVDEDNKYTDPDTKVSYTWWELRPQTVHLPASSWAAIKKYIIQNCKQNKSQCDEAITSWDRKVNSIDQRLTAPLE